LKEQVKEVVALIEKYCNKKMDFACQLLSFKTAITGVKHVW